MLVLSPTLSPKGELSIGSSSPTMIPLAWSEPQDGDVPNGNHLVEVKSLAGVLDRFEPAKNHVFAVANDDKAIAAAIAKAKARVPALKAQFTRGLKATVLILGAVELPATLEIPHRQRAELV